MKMAELTTADGKRIGIGRGNAVLIASVKKDKENPKAASVIRFAVGQQLRSQFLRDSFKHLLSLFPTALGQRGWCHATDLDGQDVAFPQGAMGYFEELEEEGTFDITLDMFNPEVQLNVRATLDEVRGWNVSDEQPAPPPAPSSETEGGSEDVSEDPAPPRPRRTRSKG